jgi:hypothetical protein
MCSKNLLSFLVAEGMSSIEIHLWLSALIKENTLVITLDNLSSS